jgi:hypothetical protein
MQGIHSFRHSAGHAAVPTYGASYLFPLGFLASEVYRLGNWLALNGTDFTRYSAQSRQYALMLALFAVQALAEAAFVAIAWAGRHEHLMNRLTNVALGLALSSFILAFDYALQLAF